ncbi:radial spoke head protein 3 homolog B isoform X2 [Sitodiplosis mosellana]|uniref:radial spoke head protein 3 homolog B isoform X2 n=1 Tax=Sitodiplosis mosellana TaxID=263140 RepID=UPI002443F8E9|nr:radial spoke head protein 3 homolog B isoform X2 [Sitodiplosis mosellana]
MSFVSSEVLPVRATTIIDPHSIESKNVHAAFPLISSAPLGPGPNAIFSVVPITSNNPTDDYGHYGKPNTIAIVRPVRRNEPNTDTMILPEANGANNLPASNQSTPKVNVPAKNKRREIDTFTKELDNKLRHLQKDKKPASKNDTTGLHDPSSRPRFFTTVPSGVYLPPSKDLPAASKVRNPRTYAYFSIPKIFAQNINKGDKANPITEIHALKTMTTYGKAIKPRESQSHPQNIMYDKRVVRGSNYSHIHMQAGDIDALSKESEAERRQLLRKRYCNRNKRSVIGTPPPVKGRRHEMIQTERYLEELLVKPSDYSVECQTDLYLYDIPDAPYITTKDGIDVATETDIDELYNFDEEVQPILDALVEMTMKQALSEFMQEEEMAELQRDTETYLAFKESQNSELKRLEQTMDADDTDEHNNNGQTIDEINAAKLLHNYVTTLLPDVLSTVDADITNKHLLNTDENFKPWLAKEIASKVGQMIDSRDSLEKLVKDIVENRAEIYLNQDN